LISPIGNIPRVTAEAVANAIRDRIELAVAIEVTLPDIEFARNHERDQYHSTAILEALQSFQDRRVLKIIALVERDLFIPILTHVYGEAQLDGFSCIVSSNRLSEDLKPPSLEKKLTERIVKEAFHELGHTFGLLHCKDPSCVMHYCRSIRDVDRKSEDFCRYCTIMLQDALALCKKRG